MTKKPKYLFTEVKNNWRNLRWWKGRYSNRILRYVLGNKGIYIMDEDWDNLIILDACRYDIFKELNIIEGKLESRISRGSCTWDFLLENFKRHPKYTSFKDVVYVTANPYVNLLLSDKFHKIYPVWDYGWDDNLSTVPPENLVKETLIACQKHFDKRLIIHFMQPHSPFLGTKLPHTIGFKELREAVLKNKRVFRDAAWWDLLEKGELDVQQVWFAYKKNLKMVLSYVKELIAMLPGRTIVTSDHGNLFGERPHIFYPFKEYGHPSGLYVKQLVLVPWLVVDLGKKTIETEKRKIRSKIRKLKTQRRI